MPTLIVMRHAKAEPHRLDDFSRVLAPIGINDASAVGKWLARDGFTPDLALVSPAARTKQTWEHAATAAGWDVSVARYADHLYEASVQDWIDELSTVSDEVGTVMCIGHNPTIAVLAHADDFPTAAATVFSFEGSWVGFALAEVHILDTYAPEK